jgi:hypothetical protein
MFLALILNLGKQRCKTLKPGNHESKTIHKHNADHTGFCDSKYSGAISTTSSKPGKKGAGQDHKHI